MLHHFKKLNWPPAATVDVVIFTIENEELKVLLIKRAAPPFKGKWALPGGFLMTKEATMSAARRILSEKAGVSKKFYLEQLYTFDDPVRDPRGHVLTVAYFALVNRVKLRFVVGKDLQMPTFYGVYDLPALAFDHRKIVQYALSRLRNKLEYTNVIYSLLPATFTLSHLQTTHEVILNKKLDKRNFRKKFLSLGLIRSTKIRMTGARQRPAQLFTFVYQKPLELKKFR